MPWNKMKMQKAGQQQQWMITSKSLIFVLKKNNNFLPQNGFFLQKNSQDESFRINLFFSPPGMSCDITRVFISTVRALSTSTSALTTKRAPATAAPPTTSTGDDDFATRARRLHAELVTVRWHLSEAGELSRTLATNDATRQRMYHEVANEVNGALEQCGEILKQLRRRCVGGGEPSQLGRHRKAVCRSLEEFLKTLQRARDEQVSTYCRRVELVGRLGDTAAPNLGSEVRKRGVGDSSWLFGSTSTRDTEAFPTDSLTEAEFKQLEAENVEVYLHFLSERNEIQRLGSQISAISRLQAMVTESLVEQAEVRAS